MQKICYSLLFSGFFFFSGQGQISLTYLNHYQLTPNAQDTTGVFCRTFYNPSRNKFYTVYAGKPDYLSTQKFSWHEYDNHFNSTGVYGSLAGFNSNVGDFGMIMVGTNYYHVTGSSNSWSYRLSKYDQDFNLINSITFPIDSSDSKADMMLNYTNGKLLIGAFHQPGVLHPTMPMQASSWQPIMHKWEYDTNLISITPPIYLNEIFTAWGSSCIYNSNRYNILSFYKWLGPTNPNFNMKVYRYDNNWNFIDSIPLNNDGQWSQGLLWDGNNYYVAYHSGHTHQAGNITMAVYDTDWNLVYDTTITNYSNFVQFSTPPLFTTDYNANRPFLTKQNDTLIVSYDVDDYQLQNWNGFYKHSNRWQAHVMRFRINNNTGTANSDSTLFKPEIFPNPTNSVTVLKFENDSGEKFILNIYNSEGALVYSHNEIMTNQVKIDCSNFPGGGYIYRLRSATKHATGKFIVN